MVKKINPFNRIIEDESTQFQACRCECVGTIASVGGSGTGAAAVHFDESCRKCGGGCGCGCGGGQGQAGLHTSVNVPLHS